MGVSLKKISLTILAILSLAVLAGAAAFIVWAETPLGPGEASSKALRSDSEVAVRERSGWIEFSPASGSGNPPKAGFVFYPGGRVDWRSYAPILRKVAKGGFFAAIVPVRLNLALFDVSAAGAAIEAHPEIANWAVGGHSLGGVAASLYAAKNRDRVRGLVLMASYPIDDSLLPDPETDLPPLAVLSVSASNDGLASPDKIAASRSLLPSDTEWVVLNGGNHAGFGDYGAQKGDLKAELSPEEQWSHAALAIVSFLQRAFN